MARIIIAVVALGLCAVCALGQSVSEGRFGQAVGSGERYAVASQNPVYTVMPLTVEGWAKFSTKSAYNILAANEPKNSVTHWEVFAERGTGRLSAYLPGYKTPEVKSDVDVVDGRWHYLAMTCDGVVARLFVDGREVGAAKLEKKFSYPDVGPLTFGHIEGVETTRDAVIDEVRISRVVRAIERVPEGPFVADGDTVGLWHFDGDGKSPYPDASTTKNPAVLRARGSISAAGAPTVVGGRNRWMEMDFGPFFTSTLVLPMDRANLAYKGVSVRLGRGALRSQKSEAGSQKGEGMAVCFDEETLRVVGGWVGGFVKIFPTREGLAQPMDADGRVVFSTKPGLGWARGEKGDFSDPRPDRMGLLPAEAGVYKGLYLNGERVIFSYAVGATDVLESHDVEQVAGMTAFVRMWEIGPADQQLVARVVDVPDVVERAGLHGSGEIVTRKDGSVIVVLVTGPGTMGNATVASSEAGRITVSIAPRAEPIRVKVEVWAGAKDQLERFLKGHADPALAPLDLGALTKGGPGRWGAPLVTKGVVGTGTGPYVVDTLTAPEENPFKSFLRFGGHDFFRNGDMAVCSVSGDVWVVSGIDEKLEQLKWRRFATGLHQPLGLRILDDQVYVLGRDQITRLHDLNGDGEADFYECFNNGCKVTTNGHGYATNLETDPEGNFYYTKCADNTAFGGTVVKVSKDGKYAEPYAVGLRNPNGLGISPSGFITEADNQGEWVPASRIDYVEPGKFLGFKPSAHDAPATDMGRPICFLPQNVDNSSGGQVWVTSDKWGPLKGSMLHTSYGAAGLIHVMMEKAGQTWQGGVVRFPLKFETGIMRGRFSPADGQLYVCGLRGWQTAGVRSGAVQRVRYTGRPVYMPTELHVYRNGVALTFATPLDRESAADAGNYSALRWTYKWTGDYPSRHYSVKDPKKQGYDTVEVSSAKLSKDGKTVFLEIPEIAPVLQQQISMNVRAADGGEVKWEVYETIHELGGEYLEK